MNNIQDQVAADNPNESAGDLFHPGTLPEELDMNDFRQFLSMQPLVLQEIENHILEFEQGDTQKAPGELKRLFHTMKGECGFLSLHQVQAVCHKTEDLLAYEPSSVICDVLLKVKDWLGDLFLMYLGKKGSPVSHDTIISLMESVESNIKEPVKKGGDFAGDNLDGEQDDSPAMVNAGNLLTIDAHRLDRLMDIIGELSIAQAMVSSGTKMLRDLPPELVKSVGLLGKLVKILQDTGLDLRMVPLTPLFSRMNRVVRDLAKKSGKSLEFSSEGETVRIDKAISDRLGDPLIHLIRNAVDHGVEDKTDFRLESGKPAAALIKLSAFIRGGSIVIEVSDDGRGLDREKLIQKAISMEIIRPDEDITDEQAFNLVFHAGFSTADNVTSLSGRGVGMDVVKKAVTALNGSVAIHSKAGMGTRTSITLPLTLSILDGIAVAACGERFIIPALSVVMVIEVKDGMVHTAFNKNEMMKIDDRLFPVLRLDRFFNLNSTKKMPGKTQPDNIIAVIVEEAGETIAIFVDRILSKQNVVRKNLGTGFPDIGGIAGSTIMPDGLVSLILDISALARTVR